MSALSNVVYAEDDKEQVTAISEAMDEGEMILCMPFCLGYILSRNFKEIRVSSKLRG